MSKLNSIEPTPALLSGPMTSFDQYKRHFANIIKDKLTMWVFMAGAFLWAATMFIPILQFVFFLKGGEWPNWILMDLIHSVLPTPFLLWIASPADWYGLHKVTKFVLESSLPLVSFVLAILFISGAIKIANE